MSQDRTAPMNRTSSAAHADTIAAVVTPPGRGGVGIVRVSGPGARDIAGRLFRSPARGLPGSSPTGRTTGA